jgi:uncharacterized protein YggL (DUF469 family)
MSKSRSKRLRKKLHVGEFQEFGFLISFMLPEDIACEIQDGFFCQFIAEAIENNGLSFGGGVGDGESEGFVTAVKGHGRGGITEEHRALVRSWLAAQPLVTDIRIGALVDAWVELPRLNQT